MSKENKTLDKAQNGNDFIADVSKRFLFQYRSCGKDLMVTLLGNSLNDVMVLFATRYHQIEQVYEIAEVS